MAANAKVTGNVEYRAGDGPLILIPQGPIEVELAPDSAVISWGDAGNIQTTAIPLAEYQRYLSEGVIQSD
ncbi:hypothetical protein ACCC97_27020 [Variovorax sp. Varisp85]|jgi:hypothetical protein|uniref:hypothetical protein n=1 Tax=unclassified Variovorax TaxID=663243 RepID=UPI000270EBE7|nr:hypothetical protein [Variovorax sp. CF313]EJL75047.1 hypothetical protein PMI12_02861 [Variovorax sp. CF313]